MLRRRKLLNIRQTSLGPRCGRNLSAQIRFHLISDVDKGPLCPKPPHGRFQALDARALHQRREQEPMGHPSLLAGRRCFFFGRAARGRPHLHQGHGRHAVRRRDHGSERVRSAVGAVAW